ncbi:hypothetical protein CAEBREN_29308 [Caenorhabditis brenneri]|uniref:Uncharacterized protein n=1 Tax=Caenorhabditis brenneri TaxID=135651 RepID=G0N2P8_CAEBE|nr:hypothetical protein CAEBREN_29308 [Caenorhabditis brenneri]
MLRKMTKPEGKLRIYHRITSQKTDDDEDWWGFRIYEDEEGYVPEEERTVEIPISSEVEWGLFEIELSCEKETEWMEKARKEFIKWKKKADKLKLQKGKKKNKCSVS